MELGMIIAGVLASALTAVAGKLNISKTSASMVLAIIGGAIYYVATNYYAATWEVGVQFVMGVYGSSQIVYNLIKQLDKRGQ